MIFREKRVDIYKNIDQSLPLSSNINDTTSISFSLSLSLCFDLFVWFWIVTTFYYRFDGVLVFSFKNQQQQTTKQTNAEPEFGVYDRRLTHIVSTIQMYEYVFGSSSSITFDITNTSISICSMHVFILLPHEMEMEKRVKRFFATNRYKYLSYERNIFLKRCCLLESPKLFGCPQDQSVRNASWCQRRNHITSFLLDHLSKKRTVRAPEYDENWNTTHTFSLDVVDSHYTFNRMPAPIHLNSKYISFHLICACLCVCCTSVYGFIRWDSILQANGLNVNGPWHYGLSMGERGEREKQPPP